MKKMLLLVAFVALAGGNAVLAQPVPGEDEDPPDVPGIVDENEPGIDPAVLEDFNENFAPWLQPPGLSIEGLPKPIGFELWKTGGGPELVQTLSNELGAWQASERAEAEEFSQRTGWPLSLEWESIPYQRPPSDGKITPVVLPIRKSFAVMIGVENGLPIYLAPFRFGAADTIGTDELWTNKGLSNKGLWRKGRSGLNLNAEGTQLAMWDGGDVLTSHQTFAITNEAGELGSRVTDVDGKSTIDDPDDGHATHVAGIMAGGGGMSRHAKLLAYDWIDDLTEMAAAVANTNNHFRISNHSYNQITGWWGRTNHLDIDYPIWHGDRSVDPTEDYKYGFYSELSQTVDDIAWWSRYYISVWAAGNKREVSHSSPRPYSNNGFFTGFTQWTNSSGEVVRTNEPQLRFVSGTLAPTNDLSVDGGYDLLTAYAVSKNSLTVGAVEKIRGGYGSLATNVVTTTNITTAPDDTMITNITTTTNVTIKTNVIMTRFSSWGPTDDGRIKPDVVAPGFNIFSSYTNRSTMTNHVNMSYETLSGTSAAAPTVSGSLNLLVQLHRRQVGNNQPMLASTLRALAIHTADEAGDHPGPDYRFGWGLFNALSAANLMTNNFHSDSLAHIKEVPLYNIRTVATNGTTKDYTDYIKFPVVARGNEPLKVTLCWNDPPPQTLPAPALDSTKRMLVNDLNLRLAHFTIVTNSNTNITTSIKYFRPWVLDPANPARAARRDRNSRDNVEQVVVESPIANGVYEVKVTQRGGRRRLTFPLRPVTGSAMAYANQAVWTNQWVSLLISGNTPQPEPALEITDDLSETNFISLRWPSVVGRVYQVRCQTNIVSAEGWLPASGEIAATRTNTAVRLPLLHTNAPSCFYRLRRVR